MSYAHHSGLQLFPPAHTHLRTAENHMQTCLARLGGFEPLTHGFGGRCSIRAELQARKTSDQAYLVPGKPSSWRLRPSVSNAPRTSLVGMIPQYLPTDWSGREDLNLRLPAPKAGALPGCATPRQRPSSNRLEINHPLHGRPSLLIRTKISRHSCSALAR